MSRLMNLAEGFLFWWDQLSQLSMNNRRLDTRTVDAVANLLIDVVFRKGKIGAIFGTLDKRIAINTLLHSH